MERLQFKKTLATSLFSLCALLTSIPVKASSSSHIPPFSSITKGYPIKDQAFINAALERFEFDRRAMQMFSEEVGAKMLNMYSACSEKLGSIDKYFDDILRKKVYDKDIKALMTQTNALESARNFAIFHLNLLSPEEQQELMMLPKTEFMNKLVFVWLTSTFREGKGENYRDVATVFIEQVCSAK